MRDGDYRRRIRERKNRGGLAEKLFLVSIKAKYPHAKIERATRDQDMYDHIDFFVNDISYDIKSIKKRCAKDEDVDEGIIWVELRNVRGDKGWLYGKCKRIAFELRNSFAVVERTELQQLVDSLLIDKFKHPPEAYHKYGRKFNPEERERRGFDCKDITTFLYLDDVREIVLEYIPKFPNKLII